MICTRKRKRYFSYVFGSNEMADDDNGGGGGGGGSTRELICSFEDDLLMSEGFYKTNSIKIKCSSKF